MIHAVSLIVLTFDCVYINVPKRIERDAHMRVELTKVDFKCERLEPIVMNASETDAYWPLSWAHGMRKRGMMSLHRTTVELIKQRNDDLLVFEDDVVIHSLNKTYIDHMIRTHPDDHVIRWDCWGDSCRRSARVRNCWCGGTHMVLYRLTRFRQSIQEFYESNLGDIDCILKTHAHSICINDGIVTTVPLEGDIPKT